MIDAICRSADAFCAWWDRHDDVRGFIWGCVIAAWVAFLLWPLPQPEVQGPTPPPAQSMPTFDKITTTVCRQEINGNVCVVRETFERKPQP